MSIISKLMSTIRAGREQEVSSATAKAMEPIYAIPTVKFDLKRVTEAVKADLKCNIQAIKEIDASHFDRIYDAAVRSISRGRDLAVLFNAIMELNLAGMTRRRASEISRHLNNKATPLMNRDQQMSLGIKHAVWMYSGAPCYINRKRHSAKDIRQDVAHRAADGKRYEIAKGMLLNGRLTMPGREEGCKCTSRPVIPALNQ